MDEQKTSSTRANHHRCACCSKAEYEFPEELMTPELLKLKETLTKEEFEALMKGLM